MSINIPDEAVDAGVRAAFFEENGDLSELDTMPDDMRSALDDVCRASLEAAAPFIVADALEHAADKIGPYTLDDPAITDPATGEYVRDSSMAIMLAPDGEDASTVRGYLRALAEKESGR